MNKMGFGFMRFPKTDPDVEDSYDFEVGKAMADAFLAEGKALVRKVPLDPQMTPIGGYCVCRL